MTRPTITSPSATGDFHAIGGGFWSFPARRCQGLCQPSEPQPTDCVPACCLLPGPAACCLGLLPIAWACCLLPGPAAQWPRLLTTQLPPWPLAIGSCRSTVGLPVDRWALVWFVWAGRLLPGCLGLAFLRRMVLKSAQHTLDSILSPSRSAANQHCHHYLCGSRWLCVPLDAAHNTSVSAAPVFEWMTRSLAPTDSCFVAYAAALRTVLRHELGVVLVSGSSFAQVTPLALATATS